MTRSDENKSTGFTNGATHRSFVQGGDLQVRHAKGAVQLHFASNSAYYLHCGAFYAGKHMHIAGISYECLVQGMLVNLTGMTMSGQVVV